jgi:O-acetyl-ADP-ribose deacetylase (regulator of RNase III)
VTPHIVESDGSIFDSGCYALVSPVDCTGAQGKGLALEFKQRWPERCAEFKRRARNGWVKPGSVHADWYGSEIILYAATKAHYREPSRVEWVDSCLREIVSVVDKNRIFSVAIPALGCGLGSLRWEQVRPLILDAAARMQCERVVVYGPKENR